MKIKSDVSGLVILLGAILLPTVLEAQAVPIQGQPREESSQLTTDGGIVHGTLLLPATGGPAPVAVIVAGSGPTDRNGNNTLLAGPNNSLKYLAEGLAKSGIAALRYDKRGIGQSAPAALSEADLRFDTYVGDLVGWVRQLRADPRFLGVFIVGHSEGALIGMLAAQRVEVDGYVSIAGVGRRASAVLRDQLQPQLPPALWQASERILTELENGRMADSVPAPLAILYRRSVQPYLISYLAVDPSVEITRLRVPILIAQGTTDLQSNPAEANRLHTANPASELLSLEGVNHVLKRVSSDLTDQQSSYSNPDLPVDPGLIEGVAGFIKRRSPAP